MSEEHGEAYYRDMLATQVGGQIEARLPFGRADVLTGTHVFEVEPASRWRAGAAQVLRYAAQVPQAGALALYGTSAAQVLTAYEELASLPGPGVELWWLGDDGVFARVESEQQAASLVPQPAPAIAHAGEPEPEPEPGSWAATAEGMEIIAARKATTRAEYEPLIARADKERAWKLREKMGIKLKADEAPPFTKEQERRLRPILAGSIPDTDIPASPADREAWRLRRAARSAAYAREARTADDKWFTDQPCACHEWHDVADIGEWLCDLFGGTGRPVPVREWAERPQFWDGAQLTEEELAGRIRRQGCIWCDHALDAWTAADGRIGLIDGAHRWTVASRLGIRRVPVSMSYLGDVADPAAAFALPFGGL